MNRITLLVCGLALSLCSVAQEGRCIKNDCTHGYGEYRYADGTLYKGNFQRARFHGTGHLLYADGSEYVGNFHKGKRQEKGRYVDANGNQYVGGWADDKKHGAGMMIYANGGKVAGKWAFGKPLGAATFTFANGDRYEGEMQGNVIAGYGTMQYFNGDTYTGGWKDNLRHGEGQMTFADQSTIKGRWAEGQYQTDWGLLGYQGDLARVPRERKTHLNGGAVFYGPVQAGRPAGNGTIVYGDGNKYDGATNGRAPEGIGVMHYTTGEIQGGVWKNGQLYRKLFTARGRPSEQIAVDYDPAVKVWAVIVGAARYNHMRTLKYTDDDAYQLFAFLKSIEGGALPDEQLRLLIDDNATQSNIRRAMNDVYQRADENDVVLFYFSGHGLKGSFLPIDYDGYENRLDHYMLKDALLASRARHKLVIADACHSGSLAGRGDVAAKSGGGDAALNRYYSALNTSSASTALLLSSKGEEISLEDGGLRSGIFSHYLIRGMKGEANINGDELISIQELFSYVHREVRRYTGNIQTPTLTGTYDNNMPVALIRTRR